MNNSANQGITTIKELITTFLNFRYCQDNGNLPQN